MQVVPIRRYFYFILTVAIISLVCVVIFSLHKDDFLEVFKVIASGILMLLASGIAGCLLGFIFGFPSYKKEEDTGSPLERNTSFKQISEWLTKIIVGVSLVELTELVSFFKNLVHKLALYLEIYPYGNVIIAAIIILFLSLGFITGYIITVTDIINIVATSEQKLKDIHDIIVNAGAVETFDIVRLQRFEDKAKLSKGDKRLVLEYVKEQGDQIEDVDFLKKLAKILFKIKAYSQAALLYEKIHLKELGDDLSDKEEALIPKFNAAFIYSKYLGDHRKGNSILLKVLKEDPDNATACYNLACNYNRMLRQIRESKEGRDIPMFEELSVKYLLRAFDLDTSLYTEAINDGELDGIDIDTIFMKATVNE